MLNLAAVVALGVSLAAPAGAETLRLGAAADAGQEIEFDVYMPLHNKPGLAALLAAQQDPASHLYHQWLTPAAFAARFAPDAATMRKVAQSLAARGLTVEIHSRSLHVTGTVGTVGRALGTALYKGISADGHIFLVAGKTPSLPQAAVDSGAFVIDFSRHVVMNHVMSRRVPGVKFADYAPLNRKSTTGGYYFDDLKQAYNYPSYQTMVTVNGATQRLDGTGATIGILMSSNVLDSDIAAEFNHEKFSKYAGVANPTLYKRVKVDGGAGITDAFDEASLDTQQALGGAPGSHVDLYEIPSLATNYIIAGYTAIVDANQADVVSSSFGGCELLYTVAYAGIEAPVLQALLTLEHEEFAQGNAQGISFLASSGDESGLACPSVSYFNGSAGTFVPSVSTPADDIDVTAVGGTNLVTSYKAGSLASAYVNENAWNDPEIPYDPYSEGVDASGGDFGAGGGLSVLYTQPAYQTKLTTGSTSARTLPDVGMQVGGCPGGIGIYPCNGGDTAIDGNGNTDRSYVYVSVKGSFEGLIGTSVSSPEFASATALLVETEGRQGNLNNYLYAAAATQAADGAKSTQATTLFHSGIPGYNGVVANGTLGAPYNYTAGVGTPVVFRFAGVPKAAVAGAPETASNP